MELKTFKTPDEITNKLLRQIPDYVIQEREAGRGSTLSYVSGATVSDILNSTFGALGWSYQVLKEWKEESNDFFDTYAKVDDKDKIKNPANGKMGAWVKQAPIAWVHGRLSVFVEDESGHVREIIKEAYGSKSIIGKQSEQEHIFKSAQTDALKKAASLLGIGAQLYRGTQEENIYFEVLNRPVVWDKDEMLDSKLWSQLTEVVDKLEWDNKTLNSYVEIFTEGSYIDIYTLPKSYMPSFIEYLTSSDGEGAE